MNKDLSLKRSLTPISIFNLTLCTIRKQTGVTLMLFSSLHSSGLLRLTLLWSCVPCWWSSRWHQCIRSLPCASWLPNRRRWSLRAWSLRWRERRRFLPASLALQSTGSAGTFSHCRGWLRNPLGRTHTGKQGAKDTKVETMKRNKIMPLRQI